MIEIFCVVMPRQRARKDRVTYIKYQVHGLQFCPAKSDNTPVIYSLIVYRIPVGTTIEWIIRFDLACMC